MNRRDFLRISTLASAGSVVLPYFLKPLEIFGIPFSQSNGKIFIIIQLSGGNDGLNTVIPYGMDSYYNVRPTLSIPPTDIIKLNDLQGLNPSLAPLQSLYDQGWLTIMNDVGYPNPDRSHFRSMDIWQSASDSDEYIDTGWIGRYLDSECDGCENTHNAVEVDGTLSLAMKGNVSRALAVNSPQQWYNSTRDPFINNLTRLHDNSGLHDNHVEDNLSYLYKTVIQTASSAEYIFDKYKAGKTNYDYPKEGFAKNLQLISQLINGGCETRIFYVSLGGFDTHVGQKGRQNKQLQVFADGISAFMNDMQKSGRLNDILVMTFSEFGRRVSQNASNGTDHGTANCMFLMGGDLKKKGIYNSAPDLQNLQDGDLKYQIDFKSVYATVLRKWLDADEKKILNKDVSVLDFI